LGRDQTVQRCNPAFEQEQILGWRADEIVGRAVAILEGRRAEWQACIEDLQREKAFLSLETQLICKNGSEFYASVSGAPSRDERGNYWICHCSQR